MNTAPTVRHERPSTVTLSVALWLGAILAGVAEALVHLAMPVPPSADQLAVRFSLYLVLGVLVLCLRYGSDLVRWAVVVLLGGVGTTSLMTDWIGWLLRGGSPAAFLDTAGLPELLGAGFRVLHVLEVAAAIALLFHPASSRFFRRRRSLGGPAGVPGRTSAETRPESRPESRSETRAESRVTVEGRVAGDADQAAGVGIR